MERRRRRLSCNSGDKHDERASSPYPWTAGGRRVPGTRHAAQADRPLAESADGARTVLFDLPIDRGGFQSLIEPGIPFAACRQPTEENQTAVSGILARQARSRALV